MGILYILIIMVMRVLQSCYNKKASNILPGNVSGFVKYFGITNLMAALLALLTLIFTNSFSSIDKETLIISILSGLALAVSSICSLTAMKGGTIVLSSMFSTAGLIVPCIAGIFMFNEPMSYIQWIGIIVLLCSAYLLMGSSKAIYKKFSLKTFLLLIGALFSNGFTMLFQKLFAYRMPNGNVSMFSLLTFLMPAVTLLIISVFYSGVSKEKVEPLPKKLILYGAVLSFAVFVINQLATLAASFMPSAILFAFINGGGMIIAAIIGAILFREKLDAKGICGIVLGIVSLLVIKIF